MVSAIFKAMDILTACKSFKRAGETTLPDGEYTRREIDIDNFVKQTYEASKGRISVLMTLTDIVSSNSVNGNICLEDADILLLSDYLLPRSDSR